MIPPIDATDGHRFIFIQEKNGEYTMKDELKELPSVTLPESVALTLLKMLQVLHDYQTNEKSEGTLNNLLETIEQHQTIDNGVLKECIRYGVEYQQKE